MHPAPADFAFRGQPLAKLFGDVAGLIEGIGDVLSVFLWLGRPFGGRTSRVDAYDSVGANADLAERASNAATFADLGEEILPRRIVAHGGAAASRRPDRR